MAKRKKLTQDIIDGILRNELAIWHFGQLPGIERPVQIVFPGQAELHDYPGKKSYFTVPNSPDKFYFKEYDYFWFVCKNKAPEKVPDEVKAATEAEIERSKKIMDEAYENPEAIPGSGSKYN